MHILFDTSTPSIDEFITNQIGSGEFKYFKAGSPFQRGFGRGQKGAGVGDIFRILWRHLKPVIKSAGTTAGRELVATTSRILDKVEEGNADKPEVMNEIKKGVDNILEKGGIGRQLGTGIKGNRKRRATHNILGKTIKKKLIGKRKRSDVFGLF